MLVYGERASAQLVGDKLGRIRMRLQGLGVAGAGLPRHADLVAALIEAGELSQGLADAEFEAVGADAASPVRDAAMALVMALAQDVRRSWRSGFSAAPSSSAAVALGQLQALPLPEIIRTKTAEGFAFYAVYPELYLDAAEQARITRPVQVIGLRSIGATLAPMVAAGLEAAAPITLRPVGHPFHRQLALCDDYAARLHRTDQAYAVVDEGPGLSGSSFAAVADRLQQAGVAPERIHIFPSHAGDPGPQAAPDLGRRWRTWPRHVADFETVIAGRLADWAADLIGAPTAAPEDISGGAWRTRRYASEAQWPPIDAWQERRKILLRTRTGVWLLKFAGLGAEGEAKLARARALHDAGFGVETIGLRHGFLVQRWLEDAKPLDLEGAHRRELVVRIGRYLAFRARRFPAEAGRGAEVQALWRMARINIAEALGEGAAAALDAWTPRLADIARRLRPVEIDGRLHPWEWLVTADGRLLKTDALDHCRAHDLVGCQDIAWDIAGASVEFDLSAKEQRLLIAEVGGVAPDVLALMTLCYRAFQLGRAAMAKAAAAGADADRLQYAQDRYARGLHPALAA